MSYRDMCFCKQSKEEWSENDKPLCANTKCERHAANIPFDKLPDYEIFFTSDFSEKCGCYQNKLLKDTFNAVSNIVYENLTIIGKKQMENLKKDESGVKE